MHISDVDKATVKNLIDIDEEKQNHYEHDFHISQKILGMLISDRHFLVQSMDLIKPEYFEDQGHQLICSTVFAFFKKYKQMPHKAFIQTEIKERRRNHPHLLQYLGELEAIVADYVPGTDAREYLMDKIVNFAKEQAVRVAVGRTIDIVKNKPEGVYNKIWELWREALTTDKGHDLGLDYLPTLDERYERMRAELDSRTEVFTTGFKGVDAWLTSNGLSRGEMGAFVGTSGSGKSITLINTAYHNLGMGKKVCYISLEMGQDKIAKRFDSIISQYPFGLLIDNSDEVINSIRQIFNHELDKRILVIKHYPGGTADVNTFRAYLSHLNLYGFKPDLLVVDYVGEMRDDPRLKTYESRQLMIRELRTLGEEGNMCVFTAMQANRQGREAQLVEGQIDDNALADSFGQARPLDIMLSLNKVQSASNVGSIFGIKVRDGFSRREIWYEMDVQTLLMKEIPYDRFKAINDMFRNKQADSVDTKLPKFNVQ